VAHAVEHLLCNHEALSLKVSPTKKTPKETKAKNIINLNICPAMDLIKIIGTMPVL
jgi:hypothetical protein